MSLFPKTPEMPTVDENHPAYERVADALVKWQEMRSELKADYDGSPLPGKLWIGGVEVRMADYAVRGVIEEAITDSLVKNSSRMPEVALNLAPDEQLPD